MGNMHELVAQHTQSLLNELKDKEDEREESDEEKEDEQQFEDDKESSDSEDNDKGDAGAGARGQGTSHPPPALTKMLQAHLRRNNKEQRKRARRGRERPLAKRELAHPHQENTKRKPSLRNRETGGVRRILFRD